MSLSPFSIIVTTDTCNGISKDTVQPWTSRSVGQYFRDTTTGKGRNAVIMGRVTYDLIPHEFRPLAKRYCVVVSRTWNPQEHPEVAVCSSLLDALVLLGQTSKSYDEVFIAGGEQLYIEAISNFMYLCRRIYVTRFKMDYDCDQFFPWSSVNEFEHFKEPQRTRDFTRHFLAPKVSHQEYQYLDCLAEIVKLPSQRPDRTGVGTKSLFGKKMVFDISKRIPVITTKKVSFENVLKELLFFVSGDSNTKNLEMQGVNIWKGNTTKKFLDDRGLDEYEEGEMGPMYGFQWRHWGAKYEGVDADYRGKGVDQLQAVIDSIKNDPFGRRHIISSWNVEQLPEMVLAPCHVMAQFYVSDDRKRLDCMLFQRSGDMFLGVPYNILSYSLLTYMISHLTGLKPGRFIHTIGDAHVYSNHVDKVKKQLARIPRPLPTLRFRGASRIHSIDDFSLESFILENYSSWAHISAKMAV